MTRIAQADADGVMFTLSQGEIVSQGTAEALVQHTSIPVVGSGQLKVVENVKAHSDFVVGFVGDKLSKSACGQ
jgi:hypothetical protein